MVQINKINNIAFAKPTFKAESPVKEQKKESTNNTDNTGATALGVYNAMLLSTKLQEFKELPLIYNPKDGEPEGEKIFAEDGTLESITKSEGDSKTVYKVNPENNEIYEVSVYDKDGNLTQKQYIDNDGDDFYSEVCEYENGNEKYNTSYKNDEVQTLYANTKTKDGTIEAYKNLGSKDIEVSINSKNQTSSVRFNDKMQIEELVQTKETPSKYKSKEVRFYNGAAYSIREVKENIIPNFLATEKINNQELTPAPKFEQTPELKDQEGEKKFYPNGELETLTNDNGTWSFYEDGSLKRAELKNQTIDINKDGTQIIVEKFDEDTTKTTSYIFDDRCQVTLKKGEDYQELSFVDGMPTYYSEGTHNENSDKGYTLKINEDGYVADYWSYND